MAPPLHSTDSPLGFVALFGLFQALLIILFAIFVEYDGTVDALETDTAAPMEEVYPMFQDVHVMIFVGFGLLMTFLSKYMYGAIGFTFMAATFCIQWYILVMGFWDGAVEHEFHYIKLEITKYDNSLRRQRRNIHQPSDAGSSRQTLPREQC